MAMSILLTKEPLIHSRDNPSEKPVILLRLAEFTVIVETEAILARRREGRSA
jgi:hypothetical protein